MVEFLKKSESRGDKIALVNSILVTKPINLLYFYGVAVRCERELFSVHSTITEKSMTEIMV